MKDETHEDDITGATKVVSEILFEILGYNPMQWAIIKMNMVQRVSM